MLSIRSLNPLAALRLKNGSTPKGWLRLFSLAVLFVVWGLVAFEIHEEREDAEEEWKSNLGNITRAAGEHTLRTIASIDQDLKFVRNLYLRDGDSLDLHGLAKVGGVDQFYIRLGIIDRNGIYRLSDHDLRPTFHRDAEDFGTQLANSSDTLIISPPAPSNTASRWSIHFTRRIVDPKGQFIGVVVASVDPAFFGDLYSEVDLGAQGVIALAGEDGILRARREDGKFSVGADVTSAPMFSTFKTSASGSFYNTGITDQIRRLFTFHRLPGIGLIVVTGVTEKRIFERSNSARDVYLIMGIFATILMLAVTWSFDRLLSTQEKTMQALRTSQLAAESANKLKSEFLASMSHELRTPLNGVLGFADILRRKASTPADRAKAEIIHSSGSHLLALLNSILDLAKIEAGKMELYPKTHDLVPLIKGAVQVHEIAAASKGLKLNLDFAELLPKEIYCDGTLLRQIINNLISNAIKFTDHGSVSVTVQQLQDGSRLRFEVRDTGMGIPADALQLIFEKFRQVDQTMTRNHQGTGLGLSLAKQLVELMGGEISVSSELGKGTMIEFSLPQGRPPVCKEQPPEMVLHE